jgi:hypothetical protein
MGVESVTGFEILRDAKVVEVKAGWLSQDDILWDVDGEGDEFSHFFEARVVRELERSRICVVAGYVFGDREV